MCLPIILALISPRLLIVFLFLFTGYLEMAYDVWYWPTLGFFFAPWTTLMYAFAINEQGSIEGGYLIGLVVAIAFDLGGSGGVFSYRRG